MKEFDFDNFVELIKAATRNSNPNTAVRTTLTESVAHPSSIMRATPTDGDDEVMLYEDESVSIWRCCFRPHIVMPPHEHKMIVHIAGYSGVELSFLYQIESERLTVKNKISVAPGEVITLDADTIHAVTAQGDEPSYALHVYMGPLMQIKRDLFAWEDGTRTEFTMENFERMKRSATDVDRRNF